jgi:calcium-binding protein CML
MRSSAPPCTTQLLHRPGWAPHALQRVLAAPHNPYPYLGGGYLTAPWPPPPDGVAQDTARWHTLVSWHITQTLASQPQFEATRRQFEEEGAAPAAAELRELARTLWRAAREGTDADEAAAVEWLQAWLRSKLALREMRAACLALEPEGWDQLRRCLAVLVIETGGWDPTHELMLQYLCQEVGGDLLQPLIPEQSVVPADGEAVSERDVQAILAMQCKLLLEDRQMVVAVLLLLVVVSGEISTQAEGFISQLIRSSKRKFADDDDADDADDDDDDGWPIGQPAGPNGAAGRQPREQGGYRASGVLGAASHFPSPGKHVVPGDDQDSLRYTAVFDDTDEAAAPPDAAGLGARRSAPHTAKLSRQQSLVLHSSIDRIFDKMHSKQAARELFAGFDTDGDGTMNLLEFGRALAAQNLELSEEQLRLLAAEMDHDHDGAIDVEDFLVKLWQRKFARLRRSFRHAASRGRRSHDWARLFHMYDQDSSGQLTFDEFLRAVRHDIKIEAKVVSDAGLREMFDHVDRSGDQHIDLMEFASMVGGTEELENEWTKRINMAEVAQLARDFCNVRRTVTMQDIVHLVSGVAIVDERGAAAAGSSSARARVPQLRMLPRPNLRGGQLVRANLARALDLSHATKAHGSRKQLFELHQNRLHSYNFLILCWAVGVLGVTAGLQVMLEAPALWHLHIFAALAAFQLCAALFGVLAVRRQQISSLKWYFVVHFFEIVLTVVVGVACFVVMGYMETYVQEVWGQDGWLDGMRRVFCAHIADRSGPVCEELVIDRTQTYLLVHGVGECCVCGLLLLSIKSAFSVIQLSELQRIYTLLILSLCANLLLGVCSLGWSVYKVALWPNDASADARLGSSVFDLAILGRSLLTLLQFLLGVRGAIAKWQGGMRAHQLLVLLQLGLAFYLVAVGAMDIDSWTVGNTPAYVADSHFGYAPCSALCAEVMTLQGVNGADFVPTNRSQNLPLGLTYLHNESCAPQTLAELQQRWRDCDARCLAEGGDLCEPMAYRTCSAAAAAAAAAREGEDAAAAAAAAAPPDEFATMLNCTCPAHVDCVLSLKVGFMNQIYAALVLAVIMLVLLALELWAGGQLLSHWDVFAHEHQAKKPQQKWKHKASIRTKRRAAAP